MMRVRVRAALGLLSLAATALSTTPGSSSSDAAYYYANDDALGGDHDALGGHELRVAITSPAHGAELDSRSPITFRFRLGGGGLGAGEKVCFTLQNKRRSYESWTQCLRDPAEPFELSGASAGVWNALAYVVPQAAEKHWRGGHLHTLGPRHSVWFGVDMASWRAEAQLEGTSGAVPRGLLGGGVADIFATRATGRRMHVFGIVQTMAADAALRAAIVDAADADGNVVVMMTNAGHLELCLNAVYSLRRVGVTAIMVFALDPIVFEAMQAVGVGTALVPGVSSFCSHCQELRDVWSHGFADIAILKPACVMTVLSAGVNAMWMDTDIVVLGDPFAHFDRAVDLSIQVGG